MVSGGLEIFRINNLYLSHNKNEKLGLKNIRHFERQISLIEYYFAYKVTMHIGI